MNNYTIELTREEVEQAIRVTDYRIIKLRSKLKNSAEWWLPHNSEKEKAELKTLYTLQATLQIALVRQ